MKDGRLGAIGTKTATPSIVVVDDVCRLTRAIASGDPEAFARLYRAKFRHVYRAARKASGFDEEDCLDVVQDAMMRVIRYMKPFDDAPALDRWLTRITRTVAFDHLRRRRRRHMRERAARDAYSAETSTHVNEIEERLEWLRRELRGLDRMEANIIELRFRAGMTLGAIGRFLGISTGSVHGRMVRAIAKLRIRAKSMKDD